MADFESLNGTLGATGQNPQTISLERAAGGPTTVYTPSIAEHVFAIRSIHLSSAGAGVLEFLSDTDSLGKITLATSSVWLHAGGMPILIGTTPADALKITVTTATVSGFMMVDEVMKR